MAPIHADTIANPTEVENSEQYPLIDYLLLSPGHGFGDKYAVPVFGLMQTFQIGAFDAAGHDLRVGKSGPFVID